MNDADVTAQPFHDFEHMGSQEDGDAPRDHALQHGFQRAGSDSVHAFERFIQKENFGTVDHGRSHCQFFLHSMRIVCDQCLGLVDQLHELQ